MSLIHDLIILAAVLFALYVVCLALWTVFRGDR